MYRVLACILILYCAVALGASARLRVLLLTSATSVPAYGAALIGLQSRGIPYDSVSLAPQGTFDASSLNLTPQNGIAPYYAVLITHANLMYQDASSKQWLSALTPIDAALRTYEQTYGARRVVLAAQPGADTYTTTSSSAIGGQWRWSLGAWTSLGAGVNLSTPVPLDGLSCIGAVISDPRSVAIAYLNTVSSNSAAAVITTSGTRQVLSLFTDHATWSAGSALLHNVWVAFLTRGVYVGARRVYFAPHVDDVLLSSDLWSDRRKATVSGVAVRFSTNDYAHLVAWQRGLAATLPAGSNVTLEMWLNGAGAVGDPTFVDAYGTAVQVAPSDYGTLHRALATDSDAFFWGTHTWSHPSLDAATYDATLAQFTLNEAFVRTWFGAARWQRDTAVTPMITGLQNLAALRAMYAHGVRSTAGDTSHVELTSPNVYRAMYASAQADAHVLIVPRTPCNIYYNCFNTSCTESQYNYQYAAYFGGASTFAQIVQRDAQDITRVLAAYQWTQVMFHQANLLVLADLSSTIVSGGASLLEYWIEAVLRTFTQYITLPILSVGQSALAREYILREAREACGDYGAWIVITNDALTELHVPAHACPDALITLPASNAPASAEAYGPDRTLHIGVQGVVLNF